MKKKMYIPTYDKKETHYVKGIVNGELCTIESVKPSNDHFVFTEEELTKLLQTFSWELTRRSPFESHIIKDQFIQQTIDKLK